jgi:hypothetical protein
MYDSQQLIAHCSCILSVDADYFCIFGEVIQNSEHVFLAHETFTRHEHEVTVQELKWLGGAGGRA